MLMPLPVRFPASFFLCCLALSAQVDQQRLNNAAAEPQNWLTYNGSYMSRHHSGLTGIDLANVKDLELRWVYQAASTDRFQTTPLVVDGVMYLTEPLNKLVALDPSSGREFWVYEHQLPSRPCCGRVNRGAGMLGNTLYWGTLDAKLLAVDAKTGLKQWETTVVEDYERGYSLPVAPLIVNDKVIVGAAGGEFGIRGFLAAYDAKTGEEVWKFHTIPGPGEPGHETWENDAWKTGGGPIWVTGSYDPDLNLTYWGVGNPSPNWNPDVRPGDNLYTDSVIALDADSGELKWHFQFTPHDEWDWDSAQIPVLADLEWQGEMRKLMLWGNRNGFYYVLDRETGKFLLGKPFVKQTWAAGLDEDGRPVKIAGGGGQQGRHIDLAGRSGRNELVRAFVQPRYQPLLLGGLGRVFQHLLQVGSKIRTRKAISGRRPARGDFVRHAEALHELHQRRRLRRRARLEPLDRRKGLGIRHDRRQRQRAVDHGEQCPVFGQPGRSFLRPRRAQREIALAALSRRADRRLADYL